MKTFAFLFWAALARAELTAPNSPPAPIDLPTVMRLAGAQAPDVALAQARLEEAQANEASTLWQFFPTLTPGIGYRNHSGRLQAADGTLTDVEKQSLNAGATVSLRLEIGEAIYRRLAAQQLAVAATQQVASQRQQTLRQAVELYFDLSRAQQTVSLLEASLQVARDFHAQVARGVQAGVAFKGDELRASAQITRLELRHSQAQEKQRHEGARLAVILALPVTIEIRATDERPLPLQFTDRERKLADHVQQALARRPELMTATALSTAAQYFEEGARYAPLYPVLEAQYFAGGLGGSPSSSRAGYASSSDTMVSLGWKIGAGGLFDGTRSEQARARLSQNRLSEQKVRDEITRQVVEAHASVQWLTQQLTMATTGLRTNEQGVKLALARKEWAVGVVLEALQTQQDLIQAKLDYVSTVADLNKAQFQLKIATAE